MNAIMRAGALRILGGIATALFLGLILNALLFRYYPKEHFLLLSLTVWLVCISIALMLKVQWFADGFAFSLGVFLGVPFVLGLYAIRLLAGMAILSGPLVLIAKLVVLIGWHEWPRWPVGQLVGAQRPVTDFYLYDADLLLWAFALSVLGLIVAAIAAKVSQEF
jgi:hypothetical protein